MAGDQDSPAVAPSKTAVIACDPAAFPTTTVNGYPHTKNPDDETCYHLARFGQQWVDKSPSTRVWCAMEVSVPAADGLMTDAESKAIIAAYTDAASKVGKGGEIISATGHGAAGSPPQTYSWADFGAQRGAYQTHTARLTALTFVDPPDANATLMRTTLAAVAAALKTHKVKWISFYNCSIANDPTFCNNIRKALGVDICASSLYSMVRMIKQGKPPDRKVVWQLGTTTNPAIQPTNYSAKDWAAGLSWFTSGP